MTNTISSIDLFNQTNQKIIQTFPTIQLYDDGVPMIGGYSNTDQHLYLTLTNQIQINLTSYDFFLITELDWSTYLDLCDELQK